jgi:hypothetical protein
MMPPHLSAPGIPRYSLRWENILPTPFLCRVRIFPFQRERKIDFSQAISEILLMHDLDPAQMFQENMTELTQLDFKNMFIKKDDMALRAWFWVLAETLCSVARWEIYSEISFSPRYFGWRILWKITNRFIHST